MSIYPEYRKANFKVADGGVQVWTEYRETPGLVEERTVTATGWTVKERTDCFCCSCDEDRPGSDPACRNHGWAAERPCETHSMPGSPWDENAGDLDGKMPASVQQYRNQRTQR